jgi:hypothetical protein
VLRRRAGEPALSLRAVAGVHLACALAIGVTLALPAGRAAAAASGLLGPSLFVFFSAAHALQSLWTRGLEPAPSAHAAATQETFQPSRSGAR